MANKITPHKGGRTKAIKAKLTPDEKTMWDYWRGGMSHADFMMYLVNQLTLKENE